MIQEILTYIIIGAAFVWAGIRVSGILKTKKKDTHAKNTSVGKGCSKCTAECIMRDTALHINSNCTIPENVKTDSSARI
ncbi:hypothetical protein MNBD_BACTEROID01-2579 [hydrothermal vent metagenome]|uniref:Uncharacterized protein n=1 Tax=hydrothermal vent metagenome TaxID=652676 RepID=A0A3B0U3H2_9ZZZZ